MPAEKPRRGGEDWHQNTRYLDAIKKLTHTQALQEKFLQSNVFFAHSNRADYLDLCFTRKDSNTIVPISVPLFGLYRCVGVCIGDTLRHLLEIEDKIRKSSESQFGSKGRIAFLLPEDVDAWCRYYSQLEIDRDKYKLTSRSDELSGLTRASTRYHIATTHRLRTLFHTHELHENTPWSRWYESAGITNITSCEMNGEQILDMSFWDGSQMRTLPIYHVRDAINERGELSLENEFLHESVLHGSVQVPGLIVVAPGENKREAYLRAKKATLLLQPYWNYPITIPVVTEGQLRLWEKVGLSQAAPTHYIDSDATSSTEDVIRFLFFGKDSVERGVLAPYLPLPSLLAHTLMQEGRLPLDIGFVIHKDGKEILTTCPVPLIGLDLSKLRGKSPQEYFLEHGDIPTKAVGDVAGIVILPDSLTKEQIKEYIDRFAGVYGTHAELSRPNFLVVTPLLWKHWQSIGTCIASQYQVEQQRASDIKNATEYGLGLGSGTVTYIGRIQPGPTVGGLFSYIAQVTPQGTVVSMLDVGANFSGGHPYSHLIEGQSSVRQGLSPYLDNGDLPIAPLYSVDWILKSMRHNARLLCSGTNDPTAQGLRAMLVNALRTGRISEERIETYLGKQSKTILERGNSDFETLYKSLPTYVIALLVGHCHSDHIEHLPKTDECAPIITSGESAIMMAALSIRSPGHTRKFDTITQISASESGNRYPKQKRDIIALNPNGEAIHVGGFLYRLWQTAHSIPGTAFQDIEVQPSGRRIIKTGDLKIDPEGITEHSISQLAGLPDVIMLETTNGPESTKPSKGKTEHDVGQRLLHEFRAAQGKLIIVATPPNHLYRMQQIVQAARLVGRQVVVMPSHALLNMHYAMGVNQLPPNSRRSISHPLVMFEDLYLYNRHLDRPPVYEKSLLSLADQDLGQQIKRSVVDYSDISEKPGEFVIVVSPSDMLERTLNGAYFPHGLTYIHSSYPPYQSHSAMQMSANRSYVIERHGDWVADFAFRYERAKDRFVVNPVYSKFGPIHTSGHASYDEMIGKVLMPLLNGRYSGKTVILEHGSHPDLYRSAIIQRISANVNPELEHVIRTTEQHLKKILPRNFRILSRLTPYNPKSPFNVGNPLSLEAFHLRID